MRKLLISSAIISSVIASSTIVAGSAVSAFASDRYPTTRHYINHIGQVVAVGDANQSYEIASTVLQRPAQSVQAVSTRILPRPTIPAEPRSVTVQDKFNAPGFYATRGESASLVNRDH